jgi:hypothetical protein
MKQNVYENLIVSQPVKKLFDFYGNLGFIIIFTAAQFEPYSEPDESSVF